MSHRQYPQIGEHKAFSHSGRRCDVPGCAGGGRHRLRVQFDYFRGNDADYWACDRDYNLAQTDLPQFLKNVGSGPETGAMP